MHMRCDIFDKLNNSKMSSMSKQSFSSINKISLQMQKLSSIMNKEQTFNTNLQCFLRKQDEKSNQSSSLVQNLDEYFKEYDNPTTKSLPIDENNNTNSQMQQQDTQIMNTMYRNYLAQEGQEEDKENLHDDKSTVIINNKNIHTKQKTIQHKISTNNYTTIDNRSLKKEIQTKTKKSIPKNPTSSMPSEIIVSQEKNIYQKNNSSMIKCPVKVQSIDHIKYKKNNQTEHQHNFIKELKGKLNKVNKIDKEELNRLQQKKSYKKTQLSSNRKNTRRQLGTVKSTTTLNHTQKTSQTNLHNNMKSNSSCKKVDSKKESLKKHQQKGPSNHQWQRNPDKIAKKLNRVNICKLQQNMKKNNQKKSHCKQTTGKKIEKTNDRKNKKDSNQRRQLKLHFTENDQTVMRKLIDEKELNRQYTKETDKYVQITKKIQKSYLQSLIQECRQTSQQAIFKIKLVTLILYFFDQFANSSLIINTKIDTISQQFFTKIPEQEIISVLLHPKKILKLMSDLPNILMNNNIISSQRVQIFHNKFQQINDQLDQQLQFFLIKKTILFNYVHTLLQYMNFLLQKQLVSSTKRVKVVPTDEEKKLQGYYSSRSKRDQISKRYIKIKEKTNKFGFRCDSDRKITHEDEQIFFKGHFIKNHIKTNPIKKVFK